jgi:hypothetical protein
VFVQPAVSNATTAAAVTSGTWSANTAEPYVVRTPAVSKRSLTASLRSSAAAAGSSVMKIPFSGPVRKFRCVPGWLQTVA